MNPRKVGYVLVLVVSAVAVAFVRFARAENIELPTWLSVVLVLLVLGGLAFGIWYRTKHRKH